VRNRRLSFLSFLLAAGRWVWYNVSRLSEASATMDRLDIVFHDADEEAYEEVRIEAYYVT
jgi:hypothetical protein